MANDVPEAMGRVNENENRSKISISAEVKKKQTNYSTDSRLGGTVEMPMAESPWGHTLRCLETNTELNGRWNLPESITGFLKALYARKRQDETADLTK